MFLLFLTLSVLFSTSIAEVHEKESYALVREKLAPDHSIHGGFPPSASLQDSRLRRVGASRLDRTNPNLDTQYERFPPKHPTEHYKLVSEKIEPGHFLSIRGRFAKDINRASVNLLKGGMKVENHDVVLHVNFRFDEKRIVYNHKSSEKWAKEQIGNLPYKPGDELRMKILIDDSGFDIFLNEKSPSILTRQLHVDSRPPIHLDHLQVLGVEEVYEPTWFQIHPLPFIKVYNSALRFGMHEVIELIPRGPFTIDLMKNDEEIGFHLEVHFPRGQMVESTFYDLTFQQVKTVESSQFTVGEIVTVSIHNEEDALVLTGCGPAVILFEHKTRNPNDDYKKLAIYGDVDVLAELVKH